MNEGSKVIEFRGKTPQMFCKDYEGGTVMVDWYYGVMIDAKPNPRMVRAVKDLLAQGVTVEFAVPNDASALALAQEDCMEIFGIQGVFTVEYDCAEYWSTKAIQFNRQGLRIDGANANGAGINIQIDHTPEEGLSVFIPKPAIQNANEQVVSMGMYLSQAITQAIGAIHGAGPESLTVAPEELRAFPPACTSESTNEDAGHGQV